MHSQYSDECSGMRMYYILSLYVNPHNPFTEYIIIFTTLLTLKQIHCEDIFGDTENLCFDCLLYKLFGNDRPRLAVVYQLYYT